MHSKSNSIATTVTSRSYANLTNNHQPILIQQNKCLKSQVEFLKQQLNKTKKEMLNIYEQNLQLKQIVLKSQDASFMRECQDQIKRLKQMMEEILETKTIGSSQREEIKDRIIMKLEDELIAVKIQLKQAKYKQSY